MVRRLGTLLFVLSLLAAPVARAQPQNVEIRPMAVTQMYGEWFIDGHHRRDNDERRGSNVRQVDTLLNEGVQLNTKGYFYHPNFIDFIAGLRLGGTQQWLEVEGADRDSSGMLLGYNLDAVILREKPTSGRVFASKSNRFIDRSFARAIEQDSQKEGFELRTRGPFPSLFHYAHATLREDSEQRTDDQESHLFRFRISDDRDRRRRTELTFEHEQVDRTTTFGGGAATTTTDLPDRRNELVLRNDWKLGDDELPHRLSGQFRFVDRQGFFNNEAMSLDQFLELTHSPTFSTFYRGLVSRNETEVQEVRELAGEAGFRKSIYDSLVITGRVDARDAQYDDGSESSYGGTLDLNYRKTTPIGIYSSGLSLSRHYETEQSDAGQRRIDAEQVLLTGVTFVSLRQPGVIAGSIIVTDVTRAVVYVQGVDFELQLLGQNTQIRRIDGGNIADPQAVLVSYTAITAIDAEFLTDQITWTHRINFAKLPGAVYFEYRRYEQELIGGDDPGNLDMSQSWLAGTEWNLAGFTLIGEHERREERISLSSSTSRARVSYSKRISPEIVASFGGHYQFLQYDDDGRLAEGEDDFIESHGLYANATTKLRDNLLLRLYGDYSNSRGRQENTRARVGGALQWHYGRMDVSIDSYYAVYEERLSEGDTLFLGFKLRRTF